MSAILTFDVVTDDFPFGRALEENLQLTFEIERIIPLGEHTFPLVWVSGPDRERFDKEIPKHPHVDDIRFLGSKKQKSLYLVEWEGLSHGLIQTLVDVEAILLSAYSENNHWTFRVLFTDDSDASEFHTHCRANGIHITVVKLAYSVDLTDSTDEVLTQAQYDLLTTALMEGYFEVPRKISQAELAQTLGISGQAVSERMRRGVQALLVRMLEITPETSFPEDQEE
ncbi:bacterio-opsin activator domain-containing protein [Halegenticoccus tardaugens]|uniref:bacterio-opsin activator domain-containing protein n=1 Tax=Halegenticoccus tardaugens TaxID=2071624 RepID=UPI00100BA037|nr:helix-turn-helix domain-containing protein [Halegenticoccus tardaugens]